MMYKLGFFFVWFCAFSGAFAQSTSYNEHVELGSVHWLRDYDQALAESVSQGKDVFILFQEIPGCATCRNYGKNNLEHPLIIEAIEDLYIPLVIFNNKAGKDAKILAKYKEPSWNNPVARIVDSRGKNVVSRLSGSYDNYSLVQYLIDGLLESNRDIPGYLIGLRDECQADFLGTKETIFSMFCFWSGEKNIGSIPGVIYTEAGFMDGKEVVKVRYSPQLIRYADLLAKAADQQCASGVFTDDQSEKDDAQKKVTAAKIKDTTTYRKDQEDKYYLIHSNLQYVPLSDFQKTKINSLLGNGLDPSGLLSPRQAKVLLDIENNRLAKVSLVAWSITEAWDKIQG